MQKTIIFILLFVVLATATYGYPALLPIKQGRSINMRDFASVPLANAYLVAPERYWNPEEWQYLTQYRVDNNRGRLWEGIMTV